MRLDANRPIVKLTGEDGNAFAIIGRCSKTARKAGWSKDQIKVLTDQMSSGDYDNLLATAVKYFDVR